MISKSGEDRLQPGAASTFLEPLVHQFTDEGPDAFDVKQGPDARGYEHLENQLARPGIHIGQREP